jgi:amino acid transporter
MTVIQTGAIAAVAFVFGEYATQVAPLGTYSIAIWAAIGVGALTLLNLIGTVQSKTLQKVMETLLIVSLLGIAVAGIAIDAPPPPPKPASGGALDFALLFVLFTYGGWNEAAYLGGEVRDPKRNMLKVLVLGIVLVTALYLVVCVGYLAALGLSGVAGSKAVAADVMRLVLGEKGVAVLAVVVCVSALTTINAAIFTGARTTYAMGQDFPAFRRLGAWRDAGSTPANALLLQGAITLLLVGLSAATPDGFSAMVAYTAPVFWTFFLLTALTLFIFRKRDPDSGLRVPAAPLIGGAFILMCAFMLWKSVAYVFNPDFGPKFGTPVLAGLIVMAIGIPVYFLQRKDTA